MKYFLLSGFQQVSVTIFQTRNSPIKYLQDQVYMSSFRHNAPLVYPLADIPTGLPSPVVVGVMAAVVKPLGRARGLMCIWVAPMPPMVGLAR